MAPNKRKFSNASDELENSVFMCSDDGKSQAENRSKSTNNSEEPKLASKRLQSSFPGIWKPSAERGKIIDGPNPMDWIAGKRLDDDIGTLWRVHEKLYNLEDFLDKHPGGKDWLELTRGTDITEAFESSHILNMNRVELVLAKYFVCAATHPRNSPYTFSEDGFYKTLKRKSVPILKKVGTGPSSKVILTQDILGMIFMLLSILGVWLDSTILQIVGGVTLGMCIVAAHNFFHMKDTWRRFYFDLSLFSSYEWRITHALSHHLYPNTIMDYEISVLEPFMEFLPSREKSLVQQLGPIMYSHLLYLWAGPVSLLKRIESIIKGKQRLRLENLIVLSEMVLWMQLSCSVWRGFSAWMTIHGVCSYYMTLIGFNAAHHHPHCFHDGDEAREDPDFGLCQLDATAEKADDCFKNFVLMLVTFGEHPLHHLFPTLCHSKLHLLKEPLEETLREYLEKNPLKKTQWELFVGTHQQCARTEPNALEKKPPRKFSNCRTVPRGER